MPDFQNSKPLEVLQERLDYRFHDIGLLKNALSHSSYANEHRSGHRKPHMQSNERLEFLGDAILSYISADYLYHSFPDYPEGDLTRIRASVVCEEALHREALSLGLSEFLLLGHGEDSSGGRERPSILADAVEAVIGAIFLDGGIDAASTFILSFLKDFISEVSGRGQPRDYKTLLQEIVQKNREETLTYRLVGENGPDHAKVFTVEVLLNTNVIASGSGHSKKAAEQAAAQSALILMGCNI